MTEQTLEAAATAAIPAIVKAMEPAAAQLLDDFKNHAQTEAAKLHTTIQQQITDHHNGLLNWLHDHLGIHPTTPGPTPPTSTTPSTPSPAPSTASSPTPTNSPT